MKYVFLLLVMCFIVFSSCDGRTTKQEALKKSVKTFRNTKHIEKIVNIFPKHYAEVENDTILSNGYRVKIKNFTNMDNLGKAPKFISAHNHHQFRQINTEIIVYKNNKLIFKKVINNVISEYHLKEKIDVEKYLNNGVSVDEIASLEQNKVVLITSNTVPQNHQNTYYKMTIDEYGNSEFKKIGDART